MARSIHSGRRGSASRSATFRRCWIHTFMSSERPAKAAIELRRGEDVGYIAMWANGMIDSGVLRNGQIDTQRTTRECESLSDISTVLDTYLHEFGAPGQSRNRTSAR